MVVGVKFCGNCNPHIDTLALFHEITRQANDIQFSVGNDTMCDTFLLLNACPVGCIKSSAFKGTVIIATSESVNFWPTAKSNLVFEIVDALRETQKDHST